MNSAMEEGRAGKGATWRTDLANLSNLVQERWYCFEVAGARAADKSAEALVTREATEGVSRLVPP